MTLISVSAMVWMSAAATIASSFQIEELVTNGSFENAKTPARGLIGSHYPGFARQQVGWGWTVEKGNVEIVHTGYDSGAGVLSGSAAAGEQWLDLDGQQAGTISQTLSTKPGVRYALSFDYANNPDGDGRPPYRAHAEVKDSASGVNLIDPIALSHDNATLTDFHWTSSGAMQFTARGTRTKIIFTSDNSANSYHGIFLDNISVIPVTSGLTRARLRTVMID